MTGLKAPGPATACLFNTMPSETITLDVREDLRQGREPFSRILEAVARLAAGQELLLLAPFEPAPLFAFMAQKGFGHESRQNETGSWEVRFSRHLATRGESAMPATVPPSGPPTLEVDARGLEPPQPLVKILEALAALPAGATLRARTDRRPMHLYAQLETRGFTGQSEEQSDGSFVTHIQRSGK